jgi:hypothetical protein
MARHEVRSPQRDPRVSDFGALDLLFDLPPGKPDRPSLDFRHGAARIVLLVR